MATSGDTGFRPALIIVDLQNDFCPPDGSLAVQGGREIETTIVELAHLPGFCMRIATQDFHPANHISFASNHEAPNNKPFESFIEMPNWVVGRESETVQQRLWPVHCVQGTPGADLTSPSILEIVDVVVQKGMHPKTEMYSVFADAFGNFECVGIGASHDCVRLLEEKSISHVFVVGLAGDYCVKHTALDAQKAGFVTCVVEEATRCVDPADGWAQACKAFENAGVRVISVDGPEIEQVRALSQR